MESLGDRIRRLREALGLSRSDLASAAGISAQQIASIEGNDTKQPSFFAGVKIARKLGVTPEELAYGSSGSPERALAELEGDVSPTRSGGDDLTAIRAEVAAMAVRQAKSLATVQAELRLLRSRLEGVEAARPGRRAGRSGPEAG